MKATATELWVRWLTGYVWGGTSSALRWKSSTCNLKQVTIWGGGGILNVS